MWLSGGAIHAAAASSSAAPPYRHTLFPRQLPGLRPLQAQHTLEAALPSTVSMRNRRGPVLAICPTGCAPTKARGS